MDLRSILDEHDVLNWVEYIDARLARLEGQDSESLRLEIIKMLDQFFSKGALTDLYICVENGHREVPDRTYAEANERVAHLRHELHELLQELLQQ